MLIIGIMGAVGVSFLSQWWKHTVCYIAFNHRVQGIHYTQRPKIHHEDVSLLVQKRQGLQREPFHFQQSGSLSITCLDPCIPFDSIPLLLKGVHQQEGFVSVLV